VRNPAWLEALSTELRRQRLPAAYSARLMEELAEHLVDVMEDTMSTGTANSGTRDYATLSRRMGAPADVAQEAAVEFRRRGFFGRHPLLTFVALPILAAPAVWIGALFALLGMAGVWKLSVNQGWASPELSAAGIGALKFVCMLIMVAPVVGCAWAFGRVAVRNGLSWRWPLMACAILGAFIAVASVDTRWSMAPNQSQMMLGLGFGLGLKEMAYQTARFAAPMAMAAWVIWREVRRDPTAIAS